MNKKLIYGIITIIVLIVGILIVNEFVLFPFGERKNIQTDCVMSDLNDLVNDSEIILIGTIQNSRWVRYTYQDYDSFDLSTNQPVGDFHTKTGLETHTTININKIFKGDYADTEIIIKIPGGCNIRKNYCISYSGINLEKGNTYLLFLTKPNKRGAYDGIDSCKGAYKVTLDSQGNIIGNIYHTYTQEDLLTFIYSNR